MPNDRATTELIQAVVPFFPKVQLKVLIDTIFNNTTEWQEKRDEVRTILEPLKTTFEEMPKTYETEHLSDKGEAIAYLHYFVGGCDWWITEKDMGEEQLQAFGVAKLGNNSPEFGYISLVELMTLCAKTPQGISVSVELDFYWRPKKLKEISELAELFRHSL